MGSIKQTNIKDQAYYFFDDMINTKNFDPNLPKIGKKSYKKYWYLFYWICRNERYW